jgi:hypothetical protein
LRIQEDFGMWLTIEWKRLLFVQQFNSNPKPKPIPINYSCKIIISVMKISLSQRWCVSDESSEGVTVGFKFSQFLFGLLRRKKMRELKWIFVAGVESSLIVFFVDFLGTIMHQLFRRSWRRSSAVHVSDYRFWARQEWTSRWRIKNKKISFCFSSCRKEISSSVHRLIYHDSTWRIWSRTKEVRIT